MKKKIIILMVSIIIICVTPVVGYKYFKAESQKDNVASHYGLQIEKEEINEGDREIAPDLIVDADYQDYNDSIDEMKNNADKIVKGTISDQNQSSTVSVRSTLNVSETLKGENADQIEIVQLGTIGDGNVLDPDKNYLLYLGKQGDELIAADPIIKKDLEEIKENIGNDYSLESLEKNITE